MSKGRTLRIIGAIVLIAAGALSALGLLAQYGIMSNLLASNGDVASTVTASISVLSRVAGGLAGFGTLLFLAAYVLFALSRGPAGVSYRSAMPVVGFIVLAVVLVASQLFFQFAARFFAESGSTLMVPANQAVNYLLLTAVVFASVCMIVRGALAGFARFALLLPAIVLFVLQFTFLLPYPSYLVAQAVYHLTWVVVAISYLLARPREGTVPAASENLAE